MQRSGSKAGRGASGGRGGRAAANGSAPSEEGKAADTGSNKADAGLLKMNYFAALSGVGDADAHKTALSAEEEQRRRAAAVGNGTAAASSRRSGGKEGTGKATSGLKQPLVWIDLEMTGLDVESDAILQIAVICTGEWACTLRRHVRVSMLENAPSCTLGQDLLFHGGMAHNLLSWHSVCSASRRDDRCACCGADGSLEELIEGPELAIHQPDDVLATMNEWCVEQHGKSGLTQACRDSGTSLAQAEQQVLEFVQQHAPEPDTAQARGVARSVAPGCLCSAASQPCVCCPEGGNCQQLCRCMRPHGNRLLLVPACLPADCGKQRPRGPGIPPQAHAANRRPSALQAGLIVWRTGAAAWVCKVHTYQEAQPEECGSDRQFLLMALQDCGCLHRGRACPSLVS